MPSGSRALTDGRRATPFVSIPYNGSNVSRAWRR